MKIGPAQAAKLAKVARSTIYRDIKEGKLSADKGAKGKTIIDISELERVYGKLSEQDNQKTIEDVRKAQTRTTEKSSLDSALQVEVEALRREKGLLAEQVEDLRRRLDDESDERRKLTMMLLEHRQSKKGFWRWLVRKN